MRLAALAALVLVLGGCEQQDGPRPTSRNVEVRAGTSSLSVTHDEVNKVTCWSIGGPSLSCIPDWMLTVPRGGSRP